MMNPKAPIVCKTLVKSIREQKVPHSSFISNKRAATKLCCFDLSKEGALFDELLTNEVIELKRKMPKLEEINRRQYCKWNDVWSHPIVNCVIFKDIVQEAIDKGIFIIGEKAPAMLNDQNPFPTPQVNLVNLNCPDRTKRRITVEIDAEDSLKPMKLIRPKASIALRVVLCSKCKCECDLKIEAHG